MREYDKPLIELTFHLKTTKEDLIKTNDFKVSEDYLINLRNELCVKLTQEYLIITSKDPYYAEKYLGTNGVLKIPVDEILDFSIEKSNIKDHLTLNFNGKTLNLWRNNLSFDNISLNMKRKINYIQEYNKNQLQNAL